LDPSSRIASCISLSVRGASTIDWDLETTGWVGLPDSLMGTICRFFGGLILWRGRGRDMKLVSMPTMRSFAAATSRSCDSLSNGLPVLYGVNLNSCVLLLRPRRVALLIPIASADTFDEYPSLARILAASTIESVHIFANIISLLKNRLKHYSS